MAEKAELSFVEIPYYSSAKKNGQMISGSTVAVIGTSILKIEITNDISDSLLSLIIRKASHAPDTAGDIRRVVLACGTSGKGLTAWQQ